MGIKFGGVTKHLEDLSQAVADWLVYQDKKNSPKTKDSDPLLLGLAMQDDSAPPEMPPQYALLLRMETSGIKTYWHGGYSAQPYFQMLEFNECRVAEAKHKNRKIMNLKLRADYENKQRQQQQSNRQVS
jgi:hypothetical protein